MPALCQTQWWGLEEIETHGEKKNTVFFMVLQKHWMYEGYEDTEEGVSSFDRGEPGREERREKEQ